MRRALVFFIAAIIAFSILFFPTTLLAFDSDRVLMFEGGISVLIGFFFITGTEAFEILALIICFPFAILWLALKIALGIPLIAICIFEGALPFILCYFLVTSLHLPMVISVVIVIAFLATVIVLWKYFGELISATWSFGTSVINGITDPLGFLMTQIRTSFQDIYNWMKEGH